MQTILPALDAAHWQARYATPGRAGWELSYSQRSAKLSRGLRPTY